MPIRPPALDDRRYEDLVAEAIARIPAHTPEWTDVRAGDPGVTLVELFAWLTDTLLYRVNLIPERQRLAFLRLLGLPLRPARAARGVVSVSLADAAATAAVQLQPFAVFKSPLPCESRTELTVLPVTAEVYCKRRLTERESRELSAVVDGLQSLYRLTREPTPYVTTPLFVGGNAESAGFDVVERTVDQCLWIALLAPKAEQVDAVRAALGTNPQGGQQLLNVGVVPVLAVPALFENVGPRGRVPHVWELSTVNADGQPDYLELDRIADSTSSLTQSGVVRLALPSAAFIRAPENDVQRELRAGVGDRPPRLDVPETAERLVAWLRLRPTERLQSLVVSWVGINAVEVDQLQTVTARVVGVSDGTADQEMPLPAQSVVPDALQLQVEEAGLGYVDWQRVDDLAAIPRDPNRAREARVFVLDSEAGVVRFGDGVRGRIPETGRRVRVAMLRAGGGAAGNLPAGSLSDVSGRDLSGTPVTKLKAHQPLPLDGGADAETLAQAERRIPDVFRHRERAVTGDDYRRLALETPGVALGRVELLPRFKPHQRRFDVPGVVSVVVLPDRSLGGPPNPRPDRPLIEAVYQHLDMRRPLATELYVIGCEYVAIGIGIAVRLRDGFAVDAVLQAVRTAVRRFLWPLAPGGLNGEGWPLGRAVRDRELEVEVARVPGVAAVAPINLFRRVEDAWRALPRVDAGAPQELPLEAWQLPELLSLVVIAADQAPDNLRAAPNPFAQFPEVAVPVVPEVC